MDNQQQLHYWQEEHGHREYDHPVVQHFAHQRLEYLNSIIKLGDIESALDVGCGNGFSTYAISTKVSKIFGGDRSGYMLMRNPLKNQGCLSQFDAFYLPFPDNTFDFVYGWEILHHISHPEIVINEMQRVSRHYVLIIEPNRINPIQFAYALIDREHFWVLRYKLKYMKSLMRLAGLEVVHDSSGGYVFPNITPIWLLPFLSKLPYHSKFGISNWVLGSKYNSYT